jgi:two-component system chemotaxis response regulator CheY
MVKRSVMVVDDSRTSRAIIRKVVSQLRPDWIIHEAASGDEAVARLDEFNPDFITMDMNMPGITGMEASRQIREQRPGLPIALCTANIQDSIKAEAAEIGIHFVAKPVTEAGLAVAITYFESSK